MLWQVHPSANQIIASGGALLMSPAWTQIVADVLGHPVVASQVQEASSRGAALMALEALRLIRNVGQIPAPLGRRFLPNLRHHQRYQEAMMRQDELYRQVIPPR